MTRRPRDQFDPAIHRVRVDSLTIFEITEAELEALERGSPESLFLNLAIANVSIATSFLVALLTTTIDNLRTFCVFVILTAVGFVASATLSLLWWQARKTMRNVAAEIRSRMTPPDGAPAQSGDEPRGSP